MSENPTPSVGEPPTWQPEQPTAAAAAAPTKAPRTARMVKLWHTAVVGAACLVVGLGLGGVFGGVIGYAVGDHGDHGRSDHRFANGGPGGRGGMGGQGGPNFGNGNQGNNGGGNGSNGSGSTQQAPSGSASQ